jgi:hypothetical protein
MTQEIVVTEHAELLDAVDDDQTEIRETFPLPAIDNVVVSTGIAHGYRAARVLEEQVG